MNNTQLVKSFIKKQAKHLQETLNKHSPRICKMLESSNDDIGSIEKKVLSMPAPTVTPFTIEFHKSCGGLESELLIADIVMPMIIEVLKNNSVKYIIDESANTIKLYCEGNINCILQEAGQHRVQRIPATESSGRIHTSLCGVTITERMKHSVSFNKSEVKVDTCKSSGAGGQHVNKTDSAVRLRYRDINIKIQSERSQLANKEKAFALLERKLMEQEEKRLLEESKNAKKSQISSYERHEKIRTYNLQDNRFTDHRYGIKVHSINKIMDGTMSKMSNECFWITESLKNKLS